MAVASQEQPVTIDGPIIARRTQRCNSRFCRKWMEANQHEIVRRSDVGWVHVECSAALDQLAADRPEPEPERVTWSVEVRLPPESELLNFGEFQCAYPGARLQKTEKGLHLRVPVEADNLVLRAGEVLVALSKTMYAGELPVKFGVIATGDEDG